MSNIKFKANPLQGDIVVTSHYGPRSGGNHRGTDFRAGEGDPVFAVDDGTVSRVNNNTDGTGWGNYIVLNHGSYSTLYAHLSKPAFYPENSHITAGTQIGTAGNTGNSYGSHLHLELTISGTPWSSSATKIDPYPCLPNVSVPLSQSSGSITSLDSNYTDSAGNPVDTSIPITYESTVVPRVVSQSSEQPMMPFVEVYVGDVTLTFMPPRYIISFECQKYVNGAGDTFTLTIFDRGWSNIEYLFSKNSQNIKLRYGYVEGSTSKLYSSLVSNYSIDFNSKGTILHINGTALSTVTNLKPITVNTETLNPTEAAKKICRDLGWSVLDENFHPSNDINHYNLDSFSLINQNPVTYIKNHLAPVAVRSSDSESGYIFYLDESVSPPIAHFKPLDFREAAHKTYIYRRGIDSPVIDLQLSMNGVFGGTGLDSVHTGLSAAFIDPLTKEEVEITKTIDDVRVNATGEYSHTNSKQSTGIVDASGASPEYVNAKLTYDLRNMESMPYSGSLVILGDLDFSIGNTIRLIILTDDGNMHHSSGLYLVTGVLDSIDGGVLQTTLSIVKRENVEDGIEIVNYRRLLK